MKEQPVTDVLLRQFLLGKVDAEERRRIESLFITDAVSKERVLTAEQELIEDYLDDCLTTADRESFLSQYAETPRQRRTLRIARSIREYAVSTANVSQTGSAKDSLGSWLWGLRLRPVFLIPIAAMLLIVIVGAGILLFSRMERGSAQHLATERELAGLNAPSSVHETQPQMPSFVLTPFSLRSAGAQTEVTPLADIRVVELRLLWIQRERYATYRAVLRRVGSAEQFTINDLRPEDDSGKAIRLRLPARLLTRGLYQINLSGIAADGTAGPAEEYSFTVGG